MRKIRLLFAPESVGVADRIAKALASSGYDAGPEEGPASAVIVVWSPAAGADPAILSAARAALARRVLIPTALGKSPPPASFEHLWPMDLSGWDGSNDDPRWRFVLDEIELAVRRGVDFGAPSQAPSRALDKGGAAGPDSPTFDGVFTAERYHVPASPRPRFPFAAMLAGFAVLGVAGGGAFLIGRAASVPTPADPGLPVISILQPGADVSIEDADVSAEDAAPDMNETLPEPAAPAVTDTHADIQVSDAPPEADPGAGVDDDEPREAQLRDGETAIGVSLASIAAPEDEAPPASLPDETTPAPKTGEAGDETHETDLIAGLAEAATKAPETDVPADVGLYFRDCVDCPDMAEIAAPGGALADYAIGVREVTNAQWKACAENAVCPAASGAGASGAPVSNVSYADALRYVAWLSGKTGRRYRLPSEIEWSFAAGIAPEADVAGAVSGARSFGVRGLSGEIWEWTMACAGAPDAAGDPCDRRVIRGGDIDVSSAGAASRSKASAQIGERRANVGFRVARDLP